MACNMYYNYFTDTSYIHAQVILLQECKTVKGLNKNHNNEILQIRKWDKIIYDGKDSKCNDSDAWNIFRLVPSLFSCSVISHQSKYTTEICLFV